MADEMCAEATLRAALADVYALATEDAWRYMGDSYVVSLDRLAEIVAEVARPSTTTATGGDGRG